jgi:non-heme chloroperoxidase
LPRDHYVRLDTSDYSVHPSVIGRKVSIHADLDRVRASCAGRLVADHERCWARHQTITDPPHAEANPGGLPIDLFDGLRADLSADRSQFYKDLSAPFYGANRPGNTVSQGLRDSFWLLSMTVGVKGAYDCIKAFSETDLTEDLKKIDVPTLIIHGDDDQIVPIGAAALQSSKIVKDATLKVYPGAPHGLAQATAYKDTFNTDLLNFIKA